MPVAQMLGTPSPLPPANLRHEEMGMGHIYVTARGRVAVPGLAATHPDTRGWTS